MIVNPSNQLRRNTRKGFLLMEALMAFAIFGIAVTSIVVALHQTAKISYEINRESWAQAHLKNLLTETLTIPVSEQDFERDIERDLPDARARIQVTPIEQTANVDNFNNQPLKKMYSVTITLFWEEDGVDREKSASTVHYYPLHQKR